MQAVFLAFSTINLPAASIYRTFDVACNAFSKATEFTKTELAVVFLPTFATRHADIHEVRPKSRFRSQCGGGLCRCIGTVTFFSGLLGKPKNGSMRVNSPDSPKLIPQAEIPVLKVKTRICKSSKERF